MVIGSPIEEVLVPWNSLGLPAPSASSRVPISNQGFTASKQKLDLYLQTIIDTNEKRVIICPPADTWYLLLLSLAQLIASQDQDDDNNNKEAFEDHARIQLSCPLARHYYTDGPFEAWLDVAYHFLPDGQPGGHCTLEALKSMPASMQRRKREHPSKTPTKPKPSKKATPAPKERESDLAKRAMEDQRLRLSHGQTE